MGSVSPARCRFELLPSGEPPVARIGVDSRTMLRFFIALAVLNLLSLTARAQEADPKQKLLLMPFATLSGEVAPRLGVKAAGMLLTELKNSEKFELVELKKSSDEAARVDALAAAKKLASEAAEFRAKRKFRLTDEAPVHHAPISRLYFALNPTYRNRADF